MGEPAEARTGSTLLVLLRDPADPQAWKAFVERYTPVVACWCRSWNLQSADVEEVTQEVLLKLARGIRKFSYDPAKGRFRGWLLTLAHNVWRDIRDARRRAGWGSGDPHVQHLLEEQEDRSGLAEALDQQFLTEIYEEAQARVQLRVSRDTWQAFQLLALEARPGAEVAVKLRLKVSAAYAARRRVQKMLAEEVHKLGG
jgi:RNA polymerase sigma-70 factor (ECF subfamily)